VPDILDESVIDHRVPVRIEDAYEMCSRLAQTGLFVGQSSGAYLCGVREAARVAGRGTIVTLLCDLGERYLSTRLWD
jgi:cysteine synthase B